MTAATGKTPLPASREPEATKSRLVSTVKTALGKPFKSDKAAPSRLQIETKAYELWLARGQEPGQDQEHWFEAERQLRQG